MSTRDRGDYDASAEHHLAIAVVKPPRLVEPIQAVLDCVNVAASVIESVNPRAGNAVRGLAVVAAWVYNLYKFDRVRPALQGVAERLERTRGEYVTKEEFADLLEDALRRIADQPDRERRDTLRTILERVMERPREHAENRLFLRLADELPAGALRVLVAVKMPNQQGDFRCAAQDVLADRTNLPKPDVRGYIDDLIGVRVFAASGLDVIIMPGRTLEHLLTRTGDMFLQYCQR